MAKDPTSLAALNRLIAGAEPGLALRFHHHPSFVSAAHAGRGQSGAWEEFVADLYRHRMAPCGFDNKR